MTLPVPRAVNAGVRRGQSVSGGAPALLTNDDPPASVAGRQITSRGRGSA